MSVTSEISEDILGVLREEAKPMGPKDIADAIGGDVHSNVRQAVRRMHQAGQLQRVSYGVYDLPENSTVTKNSSGRDDGGDVQLQRKAPSAVTDERGAIVVRVYDVKASAGGGLAQFSEHVSFEFELNRFVARRVLGIHTSGPLGVCEVVGDCMSPHLQDGNVVFFNHTQELRGGSGRHVLWLNGEPTIKRVQTMADGAVVLACDNSRYRDEVLERNRDNTLISERGKPVELHVVGPVVWPRRTVAEDLMREVKQMLQEAHSQTA